MYGGSNLQSGATVQYKASSYKAAYNIAEPVDEFAYKASSNSVEVRTENLRRVNSLVKIVWAEQTQTQSLREFRDLFSPLVTMLGFRFN